jgi:hypothetical protein
MGCFDTMISMLVFGPVGLSLYNKNANKAELAIAVLIWWGLLLWLAIGSSTSPTICIGC